MNRVGFETCRMRVISLKVFEDNARKDMQSSHGEHFFRCFEFQG